MQTIFSTDGMRPKDRFRRWKDVCEDRIVPMEQSCLGDESFEAQIDGTSVGGLDFSKFSLRNLKASTTPRTLRHENHRTDHLFVSMVLSGTVRSDQNDRSSTDRAGDFAVRDTNTPWTIEHSGHSEVLAIAIPRQRLEAALGPARIFAGLTVDGRQPVTILVRSFLSNLLREGDRLSAHSAERMVGVGIDLIVACLADRLAQEVPRPMYGTVVVQRARAFIEANLSDPSLDPPLIAAAIGVSLRRLQELFHERGQHISDCIWQRRIETAAKRLADPGCAHLSIGALAYSCGFANQSHFSRRFKEYHSMAPSEYRQAAFMSTP
ncbi:MULTISPECIES: helix-turn-helix domain-containing protein [unclassified Methylobacterium]|uniref:AraC-like ligand-binding domain-containing protein n=1 Tax=unclassified Methylobacterium TaxID=2615210 RepID=UPI0011C20214|nr:MULTISPECIES: helix-turn-helix domain-containing protein [unclassified Methylobacterium]QEE42391.1 helix-turn-helix domain-containing protein [Methylobacterium sp. WL1]TXN59664.1 helix-turn-helix domain-containing protein [Methylobacterium sp. WL2]